jgi:hypothetical protein
MRVADDRHHKTEKPYALIVGTVYGSDDRPVYGVPVKIRRADQNKAKWQLTSDHNGEFAQRLPAGAADYVVWIDLRNKDSRKIEATPKDGTAAAADRSAVTVHIDADERRDISLHLSR